MPRNRNGAPCDFRNRFDIGSKRSTRLCKIKIRFQINLLVKVPRPITNPSETANQTSQSESENPVKADAVQPTVVFRLVKLRTVSTTETRHQQKNQTCQEKGWWPESQCL